MRFRLLDHILEQSDDRIVAVKQVSMAEEYLADHFPNFPILPGVMMLETMVQAAREVIDARGGAQPAVLGEVRALKYGAMVRPGFSLRVDVSVPAGDLADGLACRGSGTVWSSNGQTGGETAVSGKFTMRPLRPIAAG